MSRATKPMAPLRDEDHRKGGPATGSIRGLVVGVLVAQVACSDPLSEPEPEPEPELPPACAPNVGPSFWLEEGQKLSATITCTSGAPLPADTLLQSLPPGGIGAAEPLPIGLTFDATTGSLAWTPGLSQAAVYDFRITLTGPRGPERGDFVVGVADAFDHPDNLPIVDPLRYREEFGLPVFFLEPGPTSSTDYAPATIYYRGQVFQAEAKKRGASSLSYPKNSYTLDFPNRDRFHQPEFGFVQRKKVVLTTTFDDNTYVRQRLAFTTWNEMNPDHLAVRVFSAVVFADGQYLGLYLVSDHIDEDFAAGYGLSEAGNVYKSINHDANFKSTTYSGAPKSSLHQGYEKKDGLPEAGQPGAFADLESLVQWVISTTPAQFRAEADTRLRLADFVDWWVLVTLIEGGDSAGKNAYLYHDPVQTGGWRYAPWDFNHSFGQDWMTLRVSPNRRASFRNHNRIFAHLLDDPTSQAMLRARYAELLAGPLSEASMQAHVDSMWTEIEPAARRDWRRWGQAHRTFSRWSSRTDMNDVDGELAYLRDWIRTRWQFLPSNFPDR